MSKYIDAEKLIAFKEVLADIIVSSQGLCTYDACKERAEQETPYLLSTITSLQQEQPEVDIVPLQEEKMVSYINYCLHREEDDCNCPNCGEHVTGLRLFPYYYDRENNDVYFAAVCPKCKKIIISKE